MLKVTLCCAVFFVAVFGAGTAFATTGHNFAGQFGVANGNGPGGFQPNGPYGVAIDQSNGDIYASDPAHLAPDGQTQAPRIERFDASGSFISAFSIDTSLYASVTTLAIDPSGPDIYTSGLDPATGVPVVLKYGLDGTFDQALDPTPSGATFGFPAALAVDPADGTLFVGGADSISGAPVVLKFNSAGVYQSRFDGSNGHAAFVGAITGLAVDGASRLYVVDFGTGQVDRYSAAGAFQLNVYDGVRGGGANVVTADSTNNQVYVMESGVQVSSYTAGGAARIDTFGNGSIGDPNAAFGQAVAVNETSHTVYTADGGRHVVERFTTFVGPTVATTAATGVGAAGATLNGTVNPNSIASSYHFEYGLDTAYGTSTADASAGSGSANVPATAAISGLAPNTLYHYRLVGTNATGAIYGDDLTLTTAPAAPAVDGSAAFATAISATGATLNGTVNPNNSVTTYHFDYGTTTGYGSVTPDATTGASQGDLAVSTSPPITGLAPGTTYHFRVSASNGTGGTINGADQTFTTAPAAAAGAAPVTGTTATLSGTVNPHGSAATYHFEYGLTTSYGTTTAEASAGSGNAETTVTAEPVTGLLPGTTYHVRVIATDSTTNVTTTGVDGTFATNPAPGATTGAATGVTTDSATLSGTADTHGLGGSYRFVIDSTTSAYSTATTPVSIAAGGAPVSATGALADLSPGGTYRVRLAVTSSGVTTVGDEVAFTTAPVPPVAPRTPPGVDTSYGCAAPVLAPYNRHPKPGDTITITGRDLGIGASVTLGTDSLTPTGWSTTGFSITLPDDATGTLPLIINCGTVSNTIAVAMFKAPSNAFTATVKTKGRTATVKVKVPGPGAITITGANVKKATKHASKVATYSVKVTLTSKAAKSLRRHHKLKVPISVSFTPTSGTAATKTLTPTFKESK